MRAVHYITICSGIALIAILYFAGNTKPPKKANEIAMGSQHTAAQHMATPASFDSLLSAAKTHLPQHAAEEVKTIENEIAAISDSSQMAAAFNKLAKAWQEHKQYPIAAYYYALEGKLDNSEKKLNFAAQLFLDLARKANSESVQAWEGQMAIDGFKRALELNPDNDTTKINLAECYIGTGETMQGVLILRDLTTKNPDNVTANLMLGQQGIVSGQYDKAIGRFERVLKVEPRNVEAMLGLAEVYKNKGDKEKAVSILEQAKKVMNNPDFSRDIDQYIKSFQ